MNYFLTKKNRRALVIAIAGLSILAIQAKTFIYHSHDCVFLSPFASVPTQRSSHHISHNDSASKDAVLPCHQSLVEVHDATKHHNHNECGICQSFQYLISFVNDPPQEFFITQGSGVSYFSESFVDLNLAGDLFLDASPRAPPSHS